MSLAKQLMIPPVVVTDANLWVHAMIPKHGYHQQALQFLRHCLQQNIRLIAPPLWEAEIDSSLRKMHSLKYINESALRAAMQWIDAAPVEIIYFPEIRFLAREIADKIHAPRVYDSTYAALAQLHGGEFWTADSRFFNAFKNAPIVSVEQATRIYGVHFILHYNSEYAAK